MNYFETTTARQLFSVYRQWRRAESTTEKLLHVNNAISVLQALRGYYLGTMGKENGV